MGYTILVTGSSGYLRNGDKVDIMFKNYQRSGHLARGIDSWR